MRKNKTAEIRLFLHHQKLPKKHKKKDTKIAVSQGIRGAGNGARTHDLNLGKGRACPGNLRKNAQNCAKIVQRIMNRIFFML